MLTEKLAGHKGPEQEDPADYGAQDADIQPHEGPFHLVGGGIFAQQHLVHAPQHEADPPDPRQTEAGNGHYLHDQQGQAPQEN